LDACCLACSITDDEHCIYDVYFGVSRVDMHRWHVFIFCEVVFT
jgi:hypothetical protein